MPAVQAERPERERLFRDSAPDLWGRSDAVFNEDLTHRYLLTRRWAQGAPTAVFLMLNPSTATAHEDDPTIRRCIGYARREGCNALTVLNLFGLRATNPAELPRYPGDPVGERNDEFIGEHAQPGRLVIAAWGVHGALHARGNEVTRALTARGVELRCLGVTDGGHPRHPLYVRADTPLIPYRPEADPA